MIIASSALKVVENSSLLVSSCRMAAVAALETPKMWLLILVSRGALTLAPRSEED
jgi:hypothetical protein